MTIDDTWRLVPFRLEIVNFSWTICICSRRYNTTKFDVRKLDRLEKFIDMFNRGDADYEHETQRDRQTTDLCIANLR